MTVLKANKGGLDVNTELYQSNNRHERCAHAHRLTRTQAFNGLWEYIWGSDHTTTMERHLLPQLSREAHFLLGSSW